MNLQTMIIVVVVGLIAGWLARLVMRGGGYGLRGDVMLGIGGSLVGGLFHVMATAPGTGWVSMIAVAFLGASVLIVAQRMFWQVAPEVVSRSSRK